MVLDKCELCGAEPMTANCNNANCDVGQTESCPHPKVRLGKHISKNGHIKIDNDGHVVQAEKSYCLACGKRVN